MNEDRYFTQNLYEASYCLCIGLKLIGKEQHGSKSTVGFEGKDARVRALGFYNDKKVGAKSLMDAYRTMKDYIFQK